MDKLSIAIISFKCISTILIKIHSHEDFNTCLIQTMCKTSYATKKINRYYFTYSLSDTPVHKYNFQFHRKVILMKTQYFAYIDLVFPKKFLYHTR